MRKIINSLFKEKLSPMISGAVKSRDAVRFKLTQVKRDQDIFKAKIEELQAAVDALEKAADEAVLAGVDASDCFDKIGSARAKGEAFNRHLARLAVEERELEDQERAASKALCEAISNGIEALRPDIHELIEGKIQDVLSALVYFEDVSLVTFSELGVTFPADIEKVVFRFLDFDPLLKQIEAYLGSIGDDFSAIRRREARESFLFSCGQPKKAA